MLSFAENIHSVCNVVGTANILEYARTVNETNKLERFIYFSTDEVFGPAPIGVDYKENDRYNSTNPYSASKAGGAGWPVENGF